MLSLISNKPEIFNIFVFLNERHHLIGQLAKSSHPPLVHVRGVVGQQLLPFLEHPKVYKHGNHGDGI